MTTPQPPKTPQERVAAGDLVFLGNMFTSDYEPMYELGRPHISDILGGMRKQYGSENVITGDASYTETETAAHMPSAFGVYVTSAAYQAAQTPGAPSE